MKRTGIYTRLVVTLLLACILAFLVDLKALGEQIRQLSWLVVGTAAVGYALTQIISASKWHLLLRSAGVPITLARTVRIFFIGMYVNAFCFGTVGGDLIRAFLASTETQRSLGLATVVADRALGLSVLACIGLSAGIVFGSLTSQPSIAFAALGLIISAMLGWHFAPALLSLSSKRFPHLSDKFERLKEAFPRRYSVILKLIGLALVYHLSQIFLIGLIITELGGTVPLSYLLFAVPFINIAGTLPLSWMGVGVREAAYAALFAPAFMTKEAAVLVGMVWLLGMTLASALGGILSAISGELATIPTRRP